MEIVDDLKRKRNPEPKYNDQQHGEFVCEICLLGEQKVAEAEQDILRVEDQIVDEISEASGARLQVKVHKNINERANEVVKLFENLLARIIHFLRGDTIVGLEPQDPKVHDQPVSEHDHEKPGAKRAGE